MKSLPKISKLFWYIKLTYTVLEQPRKALQGALQHHSLLKSGVYHGRLGQEHHKIGDQRKQPADLEEPQQGRLPLHRCLWRGLITVIFGQENALLIGSELVGRNECGYVQKGVVAAAHFPV